MAAPALAVQLETFGVVLAEPLLESLEWLGRELLRWNRTHNLTAIVDPDEVREKHLVDSLTLLPLLAGAQRLLDLGSGPGFPALPLKIVRPELEIVSVDAVGKKIAFQRHVARTLGFTGFTAVHGRAEELPAHPACAAGFDVVTARALGSLPLLAELARPCLVPGGRLIAMKGAEGAAELVAAQAELEKSGFVCTERRELRLPLSGAERCLLVLKRPSPD
ncbi:MAG: 16S rRNA (guanine(527)-N(7))-methyltransferase RsmG [Gemmatimonadales bacterium]|nr:MAG: 16S rRNA (guanine(527)-N(7))-methyltransferase RsmG [Gemmatimonadales bacterium]